MIWSLFLDNTSLPVLLFSPFRWSRRLRGRQATLSRDCPRPAKRRSSVFRLGPAFRCAHRATDDPLDSVRSFSVARTTGCHERLPWRSPRIEASRCRRLGRSRECLLHHSLCLPWKLSQLYFSDSLSDLNMFMLYYISSYSSKFSWHIILTSTVLHV